MKTYNETRDVHSRVAYSLMKNNWCVVHEVTLEGKYRIDCIAIQRVTGRVMLIECKIRVDSVVKAADQIEKYYDQFGFAGAEKWVISICPLAERECDYFSSRNIHTCYVKESTPQFENYIWHSLREFSYWFRFHGYIVGEDAALFHTLDKAQQSYSEMRSTISRDPFSFGSES